MSGNVNAHISSYFEASRMHNDDVPFYVFGKHQVCTCDYTMCLLYLDAIFKKCDDERNVDNQILQTKATARLCSQDVREEPLNHASHGDMCVLATIR